LGDLQKPDDGQNKNENAEKKKIGSYIIICVDTLEVMNARERNGKEKKNPQVLYFILAVQPEEKKRGQDRCVE